MKPYLHALSSVNKFGGNPDDYLQIHNWFDQTKSHFPDQRHRAILHTSFGIFLCEQVFGTNIKNSDGKMVSVRDIGEQHVLEDFGGKFIPTVQDFLKNLQFVEWMNNGSGGSPDHEPDKKIVKNLIPKEAMAIIDRSFPSPQPILQPILPTPDDGSLRPMTFD